jgi:hypothetical protein
MQVKLLPALSVTELDLGMPMASLVMSTVVLQKKGKKNKAQECARTLIIHIELLVHSR